MQKSPFTKYKYGFSTKIQQDIIKKGLNEEVIKLISNKKNEPKWLLDWRIKALKYWKKQEEPTWAEVNYPKIDFQDISYFASPKESAKTNVFTGKKIKLNKNDLGKLEKQLEDIKKSFNLENLSKLKFK